MKRGPVDGVEDAEQEGEKSQEGHVQLVSLVHLFGNRNLETHLAETSNLHLQSSGKFRHRTE